MTPCRKIEGVLACFGLLLVFAYVGTSLSDYNLRVITNIVIPSSIRYSMKPFEFLLVTYWRAYAFYWCSVAIHSPAEGPQHRMLLWNHIVGRQ